MILNITEYMNDAIKDLLSKAVFHSFFKPRQFGFLLSFAIKQKKVRIIRENNETAGLHIPPFLIASITSACNLFCTGCYARVNNACGSDVNKDQLDTQRWKSLFTEAKDLGMSFILLAGGEPLMRKDLIEQAAAVKNIIFPVFTNGTMFDEEYISLFDKNRNLIPIVSLEGEEQETDKRRGNGVYSQIITLLIKLKKHNIFYGASITVTNDNINEVTDLDFVSRLKKKGCDLIIYVEYVPVDEKTKQLAPNEESRKTFENRVEKLRKLDKIIIITFPGDEKALGGCLAAGRGFVHISVDGSVEPCPFSPFSDINIKNISLKEALNSQLLTKLRDSGMLTGDHTGGCLLFEKQNIVRKMLKEQQNKNL
jgi:MoaA/NifB/PqqE/SkfB family radical SAM enzyme